MWGEMGGKQVTDVSCDSAGWRGSGRRGHGAIVAVYRDLWVHYLVKRGMWVEIEGVRMGKTVTHSHLVCWLATWFSWCHHFKKQLSVVRGVMRQTVGWFVTLLPGVVSTAYHRGFVCCGGTGGQVWKPPFVNVNETCETFEDRMFRIQIDSWYTCHVTYDKCDSLWIRPVTHDSCAWHSRRSRL